MTSNMETYRVKITLEIDERSVEAASSSDAKELIIADVSTRFHKDAVVTIISSTAESE